MRKVVAILAVCFGFAALAAGPFGLEMGWTLAQCEEAKAIPVLDGWDRGVPRYRVCLPPKRHPAFDLYSIYIDASCGVFRILARSIDTGTPRDGSAARKSYASVKKQLAAAYGEPFNDIDHLDGGSIWTGRNDWMMGLLLGDRQMESLWVFEPGRDDCLMTITLRLHATGLDWSWLSIEYCSEDLLAVQARLDSEEAEAL